MAAMEGWNKETWRRELYAQMRDVQAAAVRAAVSPCDLSLKQESRAREDMMYWIEMYAHALRDHPEWSD